MKKVLLSIALLLTFTIGQSFAPISTPKQIETKSFTAKPINWVGGMLLPNHPKFIAGEYYVVVTNYLPTVDQVYECINVCTAYDGDMYTILTWLDTTWGLDNVIIEYTYGDTFYFE